MASARSAFSRGFGCGQIDPSGEQVVEQLPAESGGIACGDDGSQRPTNPFGNSDPIQQRAAVSPVGRPTSRRDGRSAPPA
ncbi:hypothetical protein ACWEKJ_10595 [Amycolatopsis thermoflava]